MGKKKAEEHSKMFKKIKEYYQMYLDSGGKRGWPKSWVADAVVKGKITPEEYEEITGEPYEEPNKED